MRRLALVGVALLLIAWHSSLRKMAAAQPSSLSQPPPSDDQDDDPPVHGLPPPFDDQHDDPPAHGLPPPSDDQDDDPPVHSLPPPRDDEDDDPPRPRHHLSPPPPEEFNAPQTPLQESPPPPEPATPPPTTPPQPQEVPPPPRHDDPPEPEPTEPPHLGHQPRRETRPPRTVVPPQEPGWAAVPLPLPPPPASPTVINYTATGYTTMLVFGDSTVDPGNNNRLQTAMKANFLPYGTSFLGGRPTGRFSNGRLITDILAEKLGIAMSIPGFHEPRLRPRQLRRGVSFASAGSGYDDATARISVCQQHNLRYQKWQTNDYLQQELNSRAIRTPVAQTSVVPHKPCRQD